MAEDWSEWDTSDFTDADWATLHKLVSAYRKGGKKAVLEVAIKLAQEHPEKFLPILLSSSHRETTEAVKDWMAEEGLRPDDYADFLKGPARKY